MTTTTEPAQWSFLQKVAFRFFFVLFLLYVILSPNGVIPFYDGIYNLFIPLFHNLAIWIGAHVLHLAKPITAFTGGSGDTTYDYVILLLIAVISIIVCLIWSVIDSKRSHYNRLLYWISVIVRYYVAITMVSYGGVKIIKLQFPAPDGSRLLERVGDMSPMGLAWTYMGYSTAFNYFTGFAELICGVLLFFRKTTTLGAIMGLVVAGNIMAINYCFDVPVKILSTALVIMSLFLLVRDWHRLVNFFFRNKEALPSNLSPHRFKARWKNVTLLTIKYVLIVWLLFTNITQDIAGAKRYGDKAKKPPLYGIYNVEIYVKGKDTLAPLVTDPERWAKLIIGNGYSQIGKMNDSLMHYNLKTDTVKHEITINNYTDTLTKFRFTYSQLKPDTLLMKGVWGNDLIHVKLIKRNKKDFRLLNRGFHMINEFPYNK